MKPGFGQQLSRRAAFGADTLLGRHRKHSNQASRHINKKLKNRQQYISEAVTDLFGMPTFHSLVLRHYKVPAHKAKWKYIHYAAQE
jgi:hypothetical protein